MVNLVSNQFDISRFFLCSARMGRASALGLQLAARAPDSASFPARSHGLVTDAFLKDINVVVMGV